MRTPYSPELSSRLMGTQSFFMAHPSSFQKLDKCLKIVIRSLDASIIKANSPINLQKTTLINLPVLYTYFMRISASETFFIEAQKRKTKAKKLLYQNIEPIWDPRNRNTAISPILPTVNANLMILMLFMFMTNHK